MINSKITELRKKKRITEKELSTYAKMSLTGFRQAMAKDDFKISTLLLISEFLKVHINYFFMVPESDLMETNAIYQTANGNHNQMTIGLNECIHKVELLKKENEGLKKEIQAKDKIIKLLENK